VTSNDGAKQLRPVMLFKNGSEDHDPGVRDFRPISEYVDNERGTMVSRAPTEQEVAQASPLPGAPTSEQPGVAPGQVDDDAVIVPDPRDPQTDDQPDEAPEHDPGIAPPEVDAPDNEEPVSPPVDAPEGADQHIPSPWDEDISE
jgi:hypothetical protein